MIVDFTARLYQQTILATTAKSNSLVVLPTGLGKTAIAFMLTAQRLALYPHSKILMLAPTKPLCEQHQTSFQKHLDINNGEMASMSFFDVVEGDRGPKAENVALIE